MSDSSSDPYQPPAEALAPAPPPPPPAAAVPAPHPDPAEIPDDFQVNIWDLHSRAIKIVFSQEFWPLLGAYFVASMVLGATGSVMGQLWLMFPVLGGLHLYVLHVIRGVPRDFGDIFLGFKRNFGQLVILNLVVYGPLMLLMFIPMGVMFGGMITMIPMINQIEEATMNGTTPPPFEIHPLLIVGILLVFVFQIIIWMIYMLFQFAPWLCIDRLMPWKDSLRVSIGTTKKRFWSLLTFSIISHIFMVAGFLACYVGVLATVPIVLIAQGLLFQDIFGTPTANGQPLPHSRSPGNSAA